MADYIAGFFCALILAALLVVWLIYCMFVKERHKSDVQYNISDLVQRNNLQLPINEDPCLEKKKGLAAGIFILPSRHKHKDEEYDKRPDYPESPVHLQMSTEKLVEIFNDSAPNDFYKDGYLEIDSNAAYQSDV